MYEAGTALQVRAVHVMPGMPPPEGERHSHDYRLEVVVGRDELDERGMVVDLDLLDQALRGAAAQIDGVDLEEVVDAEAVTVEVFARWLHDEVSGVLGRPPGVTLAVRVWESSLAFGGYSTTW
ncbi:6-pyruvoyl trahydropterin synthase family protein [Modestobacter sp. URMC 112]